MAERVGVGGDAGDSSPMRRIDHVGMVVHNADAAAEDLRRRFGLARGIDWSDPGGRFRLLYIECGDTTLQLVQPLAAGPLTEHLQTQGEGLHHVCFAVDDLDATLARLGAPLDRPPYLGGKGARVCFLTERSHGLLVELTEPPPSPDGTGVGTDS